MSEPAKILAVDDEPDFELLIKQRFRQRIRKGDLAFRFARHGEEALAVLAEEPDIDLLLLDINMPVMDGLTLLAELRARAVAGARDHRLGLWRHGQHPHRDEPRRLRFRHQAGRSQRPRDHHRQDARDIAYVRELDRAARRGRAGAHQPRRATSRRTSSTCWPSSDEPLGPVRRQTVAVLFVDIVGFTRMAEAMTPEAVVSHAARVPRAHGGADLRLRRHRREIHRRRDLRRVRPADGEPARRR